MDFSWKRFFNLLKKDFIKGNIKYFEILDEIPNYDETYFLIRD